jgi:hypothetical protein
MNTSTNGKSKKNGNGQPASFPALIERLTHSEVSEDDLRRELTAVLAGPQGRRELMRYAFAEQELQANRRKDQVINRLTRPLDRQENAYAVANELKAYFGCDRVSFVERIGDRCRIEAVSGQHTFDRRSNSIRKLQRLVTKVLRTRQPYWSGDPVNAPQLERSLDDYVAESNVRSVGILPLIVHEPERNPSDEMQLIEMVNEGTPDQGKVIGALVVEQVERLLDQPLIEDQWDAIRGPVTNAVHNSQQHARLFLMPVWKTLGKFADLYRGRTRITALLVTVAILAAAVGAVITPADFRIRCEGVIQPREQFPVYAQQDGTVNEILVSDGDRVEPGQVLVRQRNPEKEQELVALAGQAEVLQRKLEGLLYRRSEQTLAAERDVAALDELEAEGLVTRAELETVNKQVALVQSQLDSLDIKAPFHGVVFAWHLDRRFRDRPVTMGDRLFTVARTDSAWELELKVPDTRAGYVQTAWSEMNTERSDLSVSYVVTSDPTKRRRGIVRHVPPNLDVDPLQGNILPVSVDIMLDQSEREDVRSRPGTSVVGQVHCGERSLAYCKLYEFVDWSRRKYFEFVR